MTVTPDRAFEEPWQARVFAVTVGLHERGLFTWQQWADALAAAIAADPDRAYYASWLEALQALLTPGTLTPQAIRETQADWLEAAARTPHGHPIELAP